MKINYRLGPLGFMAFDKNGQDFNSNWGIQDQILALEWVNTHIEQFGGDPNRITIAGCDAGGQSVLIHATGEIEVQS